MADVRENRFGHIVATTFTGSGAGITSIDATTAFAPLAPSAAVLTDAQGHFATAAALPAAQGGTGADLGASTGGNARIVTITDGVSSIGPGISMYSSVVQTVPEFDATGGLHTAAGGISCNAQGEAADPDREFAQLSWDAGASTFKLRSHATGAGVQRPITIDASRVVVDCAISGTHAPVDAQDFVRKVELDAIGAGVTWKTAVLAIVDTPPTAVLGDRYIASTTVTEPGWTANYIYTRAAGSWTEEIPLAGWTLLVSGGAIYAGRVIVFTAEGAWTLTGMSLDHYDLLHKGVNTHDTIDAHLAATTTDPHAGQDLRATASVTHRNIALTDAGAPPGLTLTSGPVSARAELAQSGVLTYTVSGTAAGRASFANAAVATPFIAPIADTLVVAPIARFPATTASGVGAILEVYGESDIISRFARISGGSTYFADLSVSAAGELAIDAATMRIAPRLGLGTAADASARVNIYSTSGPQIQLLGSSAPATATFTSTSAALNIVHASAPVQIGAANPLIALSTTDITANPAVGAVAAITSRGGVFAAGRVHGTRVSSASAPVDSRDVWRLADQQARDAVVRAPTGFVSPTESSIAFDDGTRTLTFAPTGVSFTYYVSGVITTQVAPLTIQLPDVTGLYYISIRAGVLFAATSCAIDDRLLYPFVASVYWRSVAPARAVHISDERHYTCAAQCLSRAIGFGLGLIYHDGLEPATFNIPDPVVDTSAQFTISAGNILNEDVAVAVAAKATPAATMRVYYRLATGEWENALSTGAFYSATQQVYYGAPGLAAVPEMHFVLGHIFATNSYPTSAPLAFIGLHEYATMDDARVAIAMEMRELHDISVPFPIIYPIASVIYQFSATWTNNTYRARVIEPDVGINYVNWRHDTIQGDSDVSDHALLSGLRRDDHTQYFMVSGRAGEALRLHNPSIVTPYESTIACDDSGNLAFTCAPAGIFSFPASAATFGGSVTVSGASLNSQVCRAAGALRVGTDTLYTSIARSGATTTIASSTAAQALVFDSSIASLTFNGTIGVTGAATFGSTISAHNSLQLIDAGANTVTLTLSGGSTTIAHSLAGATMSLDKPLYVSSALEAGAVTAAINTEGGVRAAKRVYANAMTCVSAPVAATDVMRLTDFTGSALNLTPQFTRAGVGVAPDAVIPLTVSAPVGAQVKLISGGASSSIMTSGLNLYMWNASGTFYLNHDGASYRGVVSVPCTTIATSTSAGAFVVAGGIAVGAGAYFGGSINCVGVTASGTVAANAITCSSAPAVATNVVRLADLQGGASFNFVPQFLRAGVGQAPHASVPLAVTAAAGAQLMLSDGSSTASIRATTNTYIWGAGSLYLNHDGSSYKGIVNVQNTTAASAATTAALIVIGGVSAGNFWTAGSLTAASASLTGAIGCASVAATGQISANTMRCATAPAVATDVVRLTDLSGSVVNLTPQFTRVGVGVAPDATVPLTVASTIAGNAHIVVQSGAASGGIYMKPSSAGMTIWTSAGRLILNENPAGTVTGGVSIPNATASGDGVGALVVTGGIYAGDAFIKNGLSCVTFSASSVAANTITCATVPAGSTNVLRLGDFTSGSGALNMTPQFLRAGFGQAPHASTTVAITSSGTTIPQIALSNGTKVGGIHVNATSMHVWTDAGTLSLNSDTGGVRGNVTVASTVPATGASSAALIVVGGVAAGSAYIAGGATVTGTLGANAITCTQAPVNASDVLRRGDIDTLIINPLLARTGNATSKTIAPVAFAGGLGVNGASIIAGLTADSVTIVGKLTINDATLATSKITGCAILAGGIGASGTSYLAQTFMDSARFATANASFASIEARAPATSSDLAIEMAPPTDAQWTGAMFFTPYRYHVNAIAGTCAAAGYIATLIGAGTVLANGGANFTTGADSYINYAAITGSDPGIIGTIRFLWTPTQTAPASTASFFDFCASTGASDVMLMITTANNVTIRKGFNNSSYEDYVYKQIVDGVTPYVFAHAAGTEYEVEIRWDFTPTSGSNLLFVNGILVASVATSATATGIAARTRLVMGNASSYARTAQVGRIRNFLILPGSAHTTTYTPTLAQLTASIAEVRGRVSTERLYTRYVEGGQLATAMCDQYGNLLLDAATLIPAVTSLDASIATATPSIATANPIVTTSAAQSGNKATGALIVYGGAGITGSVYCGAVAADALVTPIAIAEDTTTSQKMRIMPDATGATLEFSQPIAGATFAVPLHFNTTATIVGVARAYSIGTLSGNAAIANGRLDCTHVGHLARATFATPTACIPSLTGAIRVKVTPAWSGASATKQVIAALGIAGQTHSSITLFSKATSGLLSITVTDALSADTTYEFGAFAPTAGTEYVIELNFALTAGGAIRVFVDGVLSGAASTSAATPTFNDRDVVIVGAGMVPATATSMNGSLRDFVLFTAVQHTAPYASAYTLAGILTVDGGIRADSITINDQLDPSMTGSITIDATGKMSINATSSIEFLAPINAQFESPMVISSATDDREITIAINDAGFNMTCPRVAAADELFGAPLNTTSVASIFEAGEDATGVLGGLTLFADGALNFGNGAAACTWTIPITMDPGRIGALRARFTPSYSGGVPQGNDVVFFTLARASSPTTDFIMCYQRAADAVICMKWCSNIAGATTVVAFSAVSFVAGREYEIELDFNINASGTTHMYLDGIRIGSSTNAPAVLTFNPHDIIIVGNSQTYTTGCFGAMRDVVMFSAQQHTAASYSIVPPYTLFGAFETPGPVLSSGLTIAANIADPTVAATASVGANGDLTFALVPGGAAIRTAAPIYTGAATVTGAISATGAASIAGIARAGADIRTDAAPGVGILAETSSGIAIMGGVALADALVAAPLRHDTRANIWASAALLDTAGTIYTSGAGVIADGYYKPVNASVADYLAWPLDTATDPGATGCIRARWFASFNGAPPADLKFWGIGVTGSATNEVSIGMSSGSTGVVFAATTSAGAAVTFTGALGTFVPVLGTEYELECNWDLTDGGTGVSFYVNGVQTGTLAMSSASPVFTVRNSFTIGRTPNSAPAIRGWYRDIIMFNAVQHTAATYISGTYDVSGAVRAFGTLESDRLHISNPFDTARDATLLVDGAGTLAISASTDISLAQPARFLDATAASSKITGAMRVAGGIGVSAASFMAALTVDSLATAGVVTITNATAASSKITGALKVTGGIGVSAASFMAALTVDSLATAGVVTITNATASSSKTTGALIVTGGIGASGISSLASTMIDAVYIPGAYDFKHNIVANGSVGMVINPAPTGHSSINTAILMIPMRYDRTIMKTAGSISTLNFTSVSASAPITNGRWTPAAGGYIDYVPGTTCDPGMIGTVRFMWTSSGLPVSGQVVSFFEYGTSSTNVNTLALMMGATGNIALRKGVSSGVYVDIGMLDGGSPYLWAPVTGTEYELQIAFNFNEGATNYFFVNGVMVASGVTSAVSGVVGARTQLTLLNNTAHSRVVLAGSLRNFCVFNTQTHTATYTPGLSVLGYGVININARIDGVERFSMLNPLTGTTARIMYGTGDSMLIDVSTKVETNAPFQITNATAASTKTTGALIVAGGAGIAGSLWSGNVYATSANLDVCTVDLGTSRGASLVAATADSAAALVGGGAQMASSIFEVPLRLSTIAKVFPNANKADATPTIVGTGAIIDGKYVFTNGVSEALIWAIPSSLDPGLFGSFRFMWTSSYNNYPVDNRNYWFSLARDGDASKSALAIFHNTGSNAIGITAYDSTGTAIGLTSVLATGFPAVLGQEYEILFCWDFRSIGAHLRLFIDGVIFRDMTCDAVPTLSTRDRLVIGNELGLTRLSRGSYRDAYMTNTILFTANYTPGYSMISDAAAEDRFTCTTLRLRQPFASTSSSLALDSTGIITTTAGMAIAGDVKISSATIPRALLQNATSAYSGITTAGFASGIVASAGCVIAAPLRTDFLATTYTGTAANAMGAATSLIPAPNGYADLYAQNTQGISWTLPTDPGLIGCVRIKYYCALASSLPYASTLGLFSLGNTGSSANMIIIAIAPGTRNCAFWFSDNASTPVSTTAITATNVFTSARWYDIEVNFNLTNGQVSRLFIDGVLAGSYTSVATPSLSARTMAYAGLNADVTPTRGCRGYIKDFAVYTQIQHTTDYMSDMPAAGPTHIAGTVTAVDAIVDRSAQCKMLTVSEASFVPTATDGLVISGGPISNTGASFEASLSRAPVARVYVGNQRALTGVISGAGSITSGKYAVAAATASSLYWELDAVPAIDPGITGCMRWRWTAGYTGTGGHPGSVPFVSMSTGSTTANALCPYQNANATTLALLANGTSAAFTFSGSMGSFSFVSGTEYEMELDFDLALSGNVRLFIDGAKIGELTVTGIQTLTARNRLTVAQFPWSPQIPYGKFRDVVLFDAVQHTAAYTAGYVCDDSTTIDGRVVSDSVLLQNPLDWTQSATLAAGASGVLTSSAPFAAATSSIIGATASAQRAGLFAGTTGLILSGGAANANAVFEASLRRSPLAATFAGPAGCALGIIEGASTTFLNGRLTYPALTTAARLTYEIDTSIDPGLVGCVRWRWLSNFTGAGPVNNTMCWFCLGGTTTGSSLLVQCTSAASSGVISLVAAGDDATPFAFTGSVTNPGFTNGTEYEFELDFDLNLSGISRLFINGVMRGKLTTSTTKPIASRTKFVIGNTYLSGSRNVYGGYRDVQVFKAAQHSTDTSFTPFVYTCDENTSASGAVTTDALAIQHKLDWTQSATLAVDSSGVLTTAAKVSGLDPTADSHFATKIYVDGRATSGPASLNWTGAATVNGVTVTYATAFSQVIIRFVLTFTSTLETTMVSTALPLAIRPAAPVRIPINMDAHIMLPVETDVAQTGIALIATTGVITIRARADASYTSGFTVGDTYTITCSLPYLLI